MSVPSDFSNMEITCDFGEASSGGGGGRCQGAESARGRGSVDNSLENFNHRKEKRGQGQLSGGGLRSRGL